MREPAQGQIIAGKYRLESLIGHGGMGSVWRARHASLDMPVAIKFMGAHAGGDPEARQRFDREARALASLRTPSIVQVLDHGVDDETPYIVMELLEGEDLSTRMAQKRRLGLDETSRILAQVARALRKAHESGVTHRDLKPSNIFLANVDGEEVVKVLDFGVAKLAAVGALGDQLTKTGTLLGSPGYMSPEQARGKEVDFRSDLWALAVIVFRAVTGVKPFAGDSIAELVIKLCIDPRPVATRIAGDLPPAIDRFFEKAFAAEPTERFPSAVEMASAFAKAIGQPAPELSRSGPSPISRATASRVDLDAPPPIGFSPSPSAPSRTSHPAQTMVLVPSPPASMREPTPTPASFGGFAPTAAETGSVAPSAGTPASLPGGALRPPALGALDPATSSFPIGSQMPGFPASPGSSSPSFVAAPQASNAVPPSGPSSVTPGPISENATPLGMRLHPPGAPFAPNASPPRPAPTRLDPKVLLFAAAGAAVLAIFFALAISGLRKRHTNAMVPRDDDPQVVPTAMVTLPSTSEPATSEPATTTAPSAEPTATTPEPATTTAPSAEPTAPDPGAGPTIVEAPLGDAPTATATATPAPAPKPSVTPRPTSTTPTTKPGGKTAPAGSGKKKPSKPNFGY